MTEEERRKKAAARTARWRERAKAREAAHKKGDHSQCRTDQCETAWQAARAAVDQDAEGLSEADGDAGEGVTRDVTSPSKNPVPHREPPAGLGERGLRLWDEMAALKLDPTHVALLERACRKLDRLEAMDAQLSGRAWVDAVPVPNTDGTVLQLVVDKLAGEIRQTELAFNRDVTELRHAGRSAAPSVGPSVLAPAQGGPDDDDDEPRAERSAGGTVTSIADIFGRPAQG
jgi:hypothetical protein